MNKVVLILSLVLVSLPAFSAEATKAGVSLKDCQRLTKHVPSADVAYTPGVDVRGKPVVPAQGPGGGENAFKLPDKITIDFGIDLAGKYGFSGAGDQTSTAKIMTIGYDLAAGGLTVNGKPLSKDDSRAVKKACQLLLDGKGGAK